MTSILTRVLRGCWCKHADPIFDRDASGSLYCCPRCVTTYPRGLTQGAPPEAPHAAPVESRSLGAWSRWIRDKARRTTPVVRVGASHLPHWAVAPSQVARSRPTPPRIVGLRLAPVATVIATRTSLGESLCSVIRPLQPPRSRHAAASDCRRGVR